MKSRLLKTGLFAFLVAAVLPAGELKIAVVDFQKTFMEYHRRATLLKELETQKEKKDKALNDIETRLKRIQSDLETMRPGTEKYRKMQLSLIETETSLKVSKREYQVELERVRQTQMQVLIQEIGIGIAKYAKENDIDLILSKFIPDQGLSVPLFISLYNKAELDITAKIIQSLNSGAKK